MSEVVAVATIILALIQAAIWLRWLSESLHREHLRTGLGWGLWTPYSAFRPYWSTPFDKHPTWLGWLIVRVLPANFARLTPRTYCANRVSVGMAHVSVRAFGLWLGFDCEFQFFTKTRAAA